MRFSPIALAALALSAVPAAAMSVSFAWGDLQLCTSGRPNTVPNPVFTVRDVPAGTDRVAFEMVDLDVPTYDHGGGAVQWPAGVPAGTVPTGIFTYRSPCPPNGAHTYEWRVTAYAGSRALATAAAQRRYPE